MRYVPWVLSGLFFAAAAGLLLAGGTGTGLTRVESPIGTIDVDWIIDESPLAQELNERLVERYQELLDAIGDEELAGEERAERERAAYSEYLRYRQELEDQFQARMEKVVAHTAEQRGLALVVEEQVIHYGGVNISQDIAAGLE